MLTTLKGIKVLDFGIYFAGPYSPRLLADLGADVIKVETLEGDPLRPTPQPFNAAARGKRSIAIDLKRPEGRAVAHRLAQVSDVACHNMRPGVAERLGIDYATLSSINPRIVYAYAPGWGSTGPDADRPGFAPLFAGFCGLQHEAAGDANPPQAPVGNEDNGNGLVGAGAILMALYARKRTGRGQYLENPQLNATLLMGMHLMRRDDGTVVGRRVLDSDGLGIHPLDRIYRTSDGWIAVSARLDHEFDRLTSMAPFLFLAGDGRFCDDLHRREHADELQTSLAATIAQSTSSEWIRRFDEAGVPAEVPAGDGASDRCFDSPHNVAIGRVERYRHPSRGPIDDVAVLLRLSSASSLPGRPAPDVGEHTDEILGELGYTFAEIADLRDGHVVR